MTLHQLHHAHQCVAAHQAVSIQNHHVLIVPPPAAQEIADVAALVVEIQLTTTVEQPAVRPEPLDQLRPGSLLLQPDVRVAAVRQYVEIRSEEHTSELQSRPHLVCRLLLEKKKKKKYIIN